MRERRCDGAHGWSSGCSAIDGRAFTIALELIHDRRREKRTRDGDEDSPATVGSFVRPGRGTITETPLSSTATLVRRLQRGDDRARDELVARCLPPLRRWAHGRLPAYARDLADTDDLVQTTLLRTVGRLPSLAPGETGSFLAYMRQVLVNEVRDQVRRHHRRPPVEPLPEHDRPSAAALQGRPADPAFLTAYERALAALSLPQRDAVVLRIELGMTFPEIALELGLPSADAARMRVARGLAELAEALPR